MKMSEMNKIKLELDSVSEKLIDIVRSNELNEPANLYIENLIANINCLSNSDLYKTNQNQEMELLDLALRSLLIQNRFFWHALINAWDENQFLFDEAAINSVDSNIDKVRTVLLGDDFLNIPKEYAW